MTQRFLRLFFILGGLFMLLPVQGMAETPFPTIHEPEGEGIKCVQPEDEMRRNHMNYIMHQRDKTMHEGVRANIKDEGYSLAECIDCHVQPNDNGNIASHKDEEHFCTACHEYASVQIDCFECHADKPQKHIKRQAKAQALKEQLDAVLTAGNTNGGNL
jgi:hypothetical protein